MSMLNRWMVFPCWFLVACSGSSGNSTPETLTSVTTATTIACPNGGVTISSGVDSNGDGVLETSEVTATNNVCSGSTPTATYASLVTTTMLALGDSHCPDGGTEIDTGLDNGAGGGIAGDGILQPGEITSTQYVCSGAVTASSLVSTLSLASGNVNCPTGGTEIDTGLDNGANGGTAGDGILQAGEITNRQYICSGTSSVSTLVSTTTLSVGNAHCPNGGTEIDSGLDNGADDGIAGDGILQPGEITQSQYVCSSATSNGPTLYVGSMTPPAEPAGAYIIDTSGGDGAIGNGGDSGGVTLEMQNGTLGGHAKIFNAGIVDASFAIPTVQFNAGAVPFVVSQDTILNSYVDQPTGLASGDAFFEVDNDSTLYANVNATAEAVTSIDVLADVTLRFTLNSLTESSYVGFSVQGDIRNAGSITTSLQPNGIDAMELDLTVTNYLGAVGSSIALDGQDASGGNGGNGGNLNINYSGLCVNQGNLHAIGGAGDQGGNGGAISLNANNGASLLVNTGSLDSHGGDGVATSGGSGGGVQLQGQYESVTNAGALIATGGAGITDGGNGGSVALDANNVGAVLNSGSISTSGGPCTATGCSGGSGASIGLYVNGGGDLVTSGTLDSSGGNAEATSGTGGDGGSIDVDNSDGDSANDGNLDLPTGSIRVSGSITARGGSGANGGGGGSVDFNLNASNEPLGQEIELLGYTDVNMNGGSSGAAGDRGGDGGTLTIEQDNPANSPNNNQSNYGPAGAVINYANVTARGGDEVDDGQSSQSSGGGLFMTTQRNTDFGQSFEVAANFGNVIVSGGTTTGNDQTGSLGGPFELDGIDGVQNAGAIDATAGNSTGTNDLGSASSQRLRLESDVGIVNNSGAITANGGSATNTGGDSSGAFGGEVVMYGAAVINTAAITCNGGDGAVDGGLGGAIIMFSSVSGPTVNSGTLSVASGTGASADGIGSIQIDEPNMPIVHPIRHLGSPLGQALQFDSEHYISIATTGTLSGSFTVQAWVLLDSYNGTIFGTRNTFFFDFKINGSDRVHGDIANATSSQDAVDTFPSTGWQQVVYAISPTGFTIYHNGAAIGTGGLSAPVTLFSGGSVMTFGDCGPDCGEYFGGALDEIAIWKTTLSATDVATLYSNGSTGVAINSSAPQFNNLVDYLSLDGIGIVENGATIPASVGPNGTLENAQ